MSTKQIFPPLQLSMILIKSSLASVEGEVSVLAENLSGLVPALAENQHKLLPPRLGVGVDG